MVAGTAAGGADPGLAPGALPAGGALFDGGTTLRVNCRADWADKFVTATNRIEADQQIAKILFIAG